MGTPRAQSLRDGMGLAVWILPALLAPTIMAQSASVRLTTRTSACPGSCLMGRSAYTFRTGARLALGGLGRSAGQSASAQMDFMSSLVSASHFLKSAFLQRFGETGNARPQSHSAHWVRIRGKGSADPWQVASKGSSGILTIYSANAPRELAGMG